MPEDLLPLLRRAGRRVPVGRRRAPVGARATRTARTAAHVLGYVGRITQDELDAKQGGTPTKASPSRTSPTADRQDRRREAVRGRPARHARASRPSRSTPRARRSATVSEHAARSPATTCSSPSTSTCRRSAEDALAEPARRGPRRQGAGQRPRRPRRPPASAVTLDPTNGQVVAMASYPDLRPGRVRQRHLERPLRRSSRTPTRPRPVHQPGDPGPVRARARRSSWSPPPPRCSDGLITRQHAYRRHRHATRRRAASRRHAPAASSRTPAAPRTAASTCPRRSPCRATSTSTGSATDFWTRAARSATGIQDTARAFGFGADTGIPLPGEQTGFVPDAEHARSATTQPDGVPGRRLVHRRQRQHRDRPGRRARHAAAAGQRLRHLRQRRHASTSPTSSTKVLKPAATPTSPSDVSRTIDPVVQGPRRPAARRLRPDPAGPHRA